MKCEHCGFETKEEYPFIRIEWHEIYGKFLCFRCVDKLDNSEWWSDEFAERYGLPPFPRQKARRMGEY